jgi:hypothetical protein
MTDVQVQVSKTVPSSQSELASLSPLGPKVQINGDKNGFNSKSAVDKFKQVVKSDSNFDLAELSKKFIKNNYQLELENNLNNQYVFNIKQVSSELSSQEPNIKNKNKHELLRAKIHNMNQMRTNGYYQKAKSSSDVPPDILAEYKKLIKVSKMPIPEPSEILANPEQYKPIISMVLGNSMMKSLPQSHPYIKYFKLLAKQLGAEEILPVPTKDFSNNTELPNNLEQIMKMSGPRTISKDENTDSEDD